MEPQTPLMLCMKNAAGEDITLRIEPEDDFQTFLDKAKSILGFDIDINSITRNQPVSLDENIHQFLSEQIETDPDLLQNFDQILEPSEGSNDLVYILDDGTQIRASQIHFDNEDPPLDLTAEKIPFVKYADNNSDEIILENVRDEDTKKYNIVESPVSHWSSQNSSPKTFVNSLPFKLVCNNTLIFDAQFTKYLEASSKTYATLNPVGNRNKSPRSLISDNYKNYNDNFNRNDDVAITREEVLNMFKDSPVASLPYECPLAEKRKHVRKTDPSRLVHRSCNPKTSGERVLIGDNESRNCFICGKFVENNVDKLYLFNNEDQKIHRTSPQRKGSRQLKIICDSCLAENFKPCLMKGPNQYLEPDQYLIIKNNQQYMFQKKNDFAFKGNFVLNEVLKSPISKEKEKLEFVKVEIGFDGEIITKTIDEVPDLSDDVIIVKDEDKDVSSSDVEVVESPELDDNIIDNLDEADEEVKEFLGKYHCEGNSEPKELKCRFCEKVFSAIPQVIDHGEVHKHEMEDEAVFPCPLCDYGYANLKWLLGHIKAAHEKRQNEELNKDSELNENKEDVIESSSTSPIAKRTRSSIKKSYTDKQTDCTKSEETKETELKSELTDTVLDATVKIEVKQECVESSEDEIWIVHTDDDQLEQILDSVKDKNKEQGDASKIEKCLTYSETFLSPEDLTGHKKRRGRKPKIPNKNKNVLYMPTKEDFMKRAQGRLRRVDKPNNDLLVERPRRKKSKPTSDPQIVTCHNCNESFTSKVRLKFHMQFHEPTSLLSPEGKYLCPQCEHVTFVTETALFDHVHFQHDKLKRWQCPVVGCGKTFYLRATLTKHSRTHTDTRRYECVACGKRFLDKQTLDEHGVTHLQIKPYQCHICLKHLTRRSRLRMHLRAHEEELSPKLVLVCAVCSRGFRDQGDAEEHTKSSKCIEEFASELKEEEDTTVQLSPTSGLVRHTVQCADSPKLSKPIPRQVEDCIAEPLLSELADEARTIIRVVEIEKAFRCEYCEDIFYMEDALNKHRLIHKDVKNPFICHICKVTFATYSRCTTHKTTHGFYKRPLAEVKRDAGRPDKSEEVPTATGILGYGGFPVVKHFLCEDCGRSYLHWTYLQVHRRMKHANQNCVHKCSQCEQTFPNSWSLVYHRKKVHGKTNQDDGKTPRNDHKIPCRDCDQLLPNKTALYKHRKKEHSGLSLSVIGGPGVFYGDTCGQNYGIQEAHTLSHSGFDAASAASGLTCRRCGLTFQEYDDMVVHCRNSHGEEVGVETGVGANMGLGGERGYRCDVCGRRFRSAAARDEHLRVHTGERPYPCDLCGVAFRRPTAMRNHRLIHTGLRAWACDRCPKRFRIRSDLRTHLRLKHPAYLAVIEVLGLNPTKDELMELLRINNIRHEKVIEITKMSFCKGTKSLIPSCARALSLLGGVPRTQMAFTRPALPESSVSQPVRRGRGIAKTPRRPKILQRGEIFPQPGAAQCPVALNATGEELTDLDVQMLLREGTLVNGNQMVELTLDDNMLLD